MQSAFIPNRLIMDNIMVAFELLNSLKLNKKKRDGAMAIKLDIFETYDRIKMALFKSCHDDYGFHRELNQSNHDLCNVSLLLWGA